MKSQQIIKKVLVDYSMSIQEAIKVSQNTTQNLDNVENIILNIKNYEKIRKGIIEIDVIFFKLDNDGRVISQEDLEKEYKLRGLEALDPHLVCAANRDNFSKTYPNATQLRDKNGNMFFITNYFLGDEKLVNIYMMNKSHMWKEKWWFAGVKIQKENPWKFFSFFLKFLKRN